MAKSSKNNSETKNNLDDYLRILGFENLVGVDEAGRGPLAGPVVACAVILPQYIRLKGVNDSKTLSKYERTKLLPLILETSLDCSVGIAFHPQNGPNPLSELASHVI